jgi:hypothetical protein
MRISTRLSGISLQDWSGHERDLGSYWKDRTVVLVFIRNFG